MIDHFPPLLFFWIMLIITIVVHFFPDLCRILGWEESSVKFWMEVGGVALISLILIHSAYEWLRDWLKRRRTDWVKLAQTWAATGRRHSLAEANLREADLSRVDLGASEEGGKGTDLARADLRASNLESANLSYANLIRANLKSASLKSTNLQGAKLWYANLKGTNLEGADLSGAELEHANLVLVWKV